MRWHTYCRSATRVRKYNKETKWNTSNIFHWQPIKQLVSQSKVITSLPVCASSRHLSTFFFIICSPWRRPHRHFFCVALRHAVQCCQSRVKTRQLQLEAPIAVAVVPIAAFHFAQRSDSFIFKLSGDPRLITMFLSPVLLFMSNISVYYVVSMSIFVVSMTFFVVSLSTFSPRNCHVSILLDVLIDIQYLFVDCFILLKYFCQVQ